jgi:hypothetical protein
MPLGSIIHFLLSSLISSFFHTMKIFILLFLIISCHILSLSQASEELKSKLKAALDKTTTTLESLSKEWEISQYPNFLKSCYMHKSSWEVMKWKYMMKILNAAVNQKKEKFVISFTGR